MSNTPRTDLKAFIAHWPISWMREESGPVVDASFARELEDEMTMLRQDAFRYRAIRSSGTDHMRRTLTDWAGDVLALGEELDAAVDAAIVEMDKLYQAEARHA